MNTTQFYGVHTALVTPMRDGKVAWDDLDRLVETQVAQGINGLVAVGTTGESPTLDYDEHIEVVARVVKKVAGRVPVLAGTGSNSTDEAIELTQRAEAAGATGFLLVAPYYNKPSQEGLFLHFSKIAEATRLPIVLYSIPGRCGIEISTPTVARLRAKFPHVVGIKEAGGSCEKVSQLAMELGRDFVVLSGDDSLTLPFMACGAKGIISVASNLVVADLVKMVRLALDNNFAEALKLHQRYFPLFKDLFIEPNPVPVKHAMARAGLIGSAEVRLPLCGISDAARKQLEATLQKLGL